MISIVFCLLSILIIFAHLSESRLVIVRDYEDDPLDRHTGSRSSPDYADNDKPTSLSPNNKPKRTRNSKKTVLHYGRHIYHLDKFQDKMTTRQYKPQIVTFNYVDLYHLLQPKGPMNRGATKFLKDLIIFSESPIHICNGGKCDEDLRKFSKFDKKEGWERSRHKFNGRLKRFQIVDNRKKPKEPQLDSSEEYYKKDRPKKKRYKKNYSSESSESKESSSEEHHTHKKQKNKSYSSSKSSEEEIRKPKRYYDSNSASGSSEKSKNSEEEYSRSEEEFDDRKKNRHTNDGELSDNETKRKTFKNHEHFFVQGSKIFFVRDGSGKIKHNVKRRRLETFLPKRYHWDPDDIQELGYYWFNGPKGIYPAPQLLPPIHRKK